jgi:hypothetical protein
VKRCAIVSEDCLPERHTDVNGRYHDGEMGWLRCCSLVYLRSCATQSVPIKYVKVKRVESEPGERSVGTKTRHCAY